MTISGRIERISPALAKDYLGLNTDNWRKVNLQHVRRLAADMAAGDWATGTGTIDFGEDGKLADGQHRLLAVVESGVTVEFLVRRNVPLAVIENTDTGRRRTFADLLAHRGEPHATALAAGTALHLRWARGVPVSGGDNPTFSTLTAWLDGYAGLRPATRPGAALSRAVGMKASIGTAIAYEFARIDEAEGPAFVSLLISGSNLAEDCAVLHLRRQLLNRAASRYRITPTDELAFTIKAWNAWISGTPVRVLSYRRGGAKPEPFPVPITADGAAWEVR
jgi:hypothetical protein